MKIQTYRFDGLTPLLMANIKSVAADIPQPKLGTKPNKGDFEKIAEAMTYRNEDGNLCMPTQALRSSLLQGCVGQKFPGMRQGPQKLFQALVFPAENTAEILDDKGKPIRDISAVQVDSGVNKATKSRIIVVRPRIDNWHLVVPFEIDEEFAPENFDQFLVELERIWNRAGRMAGIGAWRPEKQGRHGKYSVVDAAHAVDADTTKRKPRAPRVESVPLQSEPPRLHSRPRSVDWDGHDAI